MKTKSLLHRFRQQAFFQVILIAMTLWAIVFAYLPIMGNVIAFQNYKINLGFLHSPWVGMAHFQSFFNNRMTLTLIRNTVAMSVLSLGFGTLAAVGFALLLNELRAGLFKRSVQTVSYLPYFISMAVCANLWIQFLSRTGPVNNLLINTGLISAPLPFLERGDGYWFVLTLQSIWKNMGWNSIIYLAAIAGIPQETYEAAAVDGAGRFRKIWHITIPGILPTIMILLIMNCGSLFAGSFEQQLLMQNPMVMNYAETIGTYVYKIGLGQMQFSFATAIGLFQSVVGLLLVFIANTISGRVSQINLW